MEPKRSRFSRGSSVRLDAPIGHGSKLTRSSYDSDRFGRATELIARGMGTPWFLLGLSFFCLLWLAWNTLMPAQWRFDSADNGFTALTLVLSLQASYAAPLILLAQNRQDDRDRVQIEQDRQRAERNMADTEYLAREVVSLRMRIQELNEQALTRDELRADLEELLSKLSEKPADKPEKLGDLS